MRSVFFKCVPEAKVQQLPTMEQRQKYYEEMLNIAEKYKKEIGVDAIYHFKTSITTQTEISRGSFDKLHKELKKAVQSIEAKHSVSTKEVATTALAGGGIGCVAGGVFGSLFWLSLPPSVLFFPIVGPAVGVLALYGMAIGSIVTCVGSDQNHPKSSEYKAYIRLFRDDVSRFKQLTDKYFGVSLLDTLEGDSLSSAPELKR